MASVESDIPFERTKFDAKLFELVFRRHVDLLCRRLSFPEFSSVLILSFLMCYQNISTWYRVIGTIGQKVSP